MDIGKMIKDKRLGLGLTMQDVADRAGVVKSTIKKWESGNVEKMSVENMIKLARALDISPVDLIRFLDDNPSVPDVNDTDGLYGALIDENRSVVDQLIKSLASQQSRFLDHDR